MAFIQKSFVVSLHIDEFTFIAYAQKRQSERLLRPEKCKRDSMFKTSSNNSKWQNIHRYYALDSLYAEGFRVHLTSALHSRMAILINLIKSCNYYHNRVIISTRGTGNDETFAKYTDIQNM